MKRTNKSFQFCSFLKYLILLLPMCLSACSSSDSSTGGGCDVVANPDGPAFFRVENQLNSGLSWHLPAFAFGADMKPGECTIMGVISRQYIVEIQQCDIGDAACTSTFGPVKSIVFSVLEGETYTLNVTNTTFN